MAPEAPVQGTHRNVPAVTRAVRILRRLGASTEPLGVNRLARDLDLIPSTCLHILRVLTAEGLVEFDPATKRYQLGVGILAIARAAIQRNDFATLAQPLLATLSRRFDVTAMATQIMPSRQMIVVALKHAETPFRLSADLGSRFPELISATGRCVAAFNGYGEADLRAGFAGLMWDDPPTVDEWLGEVETTRARGYGVDRGRYIGGVTIIAAPIFDSDGVMTRGLVSIGIAEKVEAAGVDVIAREMLRLRDELTAYLFTG